MVNMKKFLLTIGLLAVSITGCGKEKNSLIPIDIEEYERVVYDSAEVMQGDITPIISLKVLPADMENVSYFPAKNEMEVDRIFVKAGDFVHAGDVMVTFKSREIQEKVTEYENELAEIKLLIDHYEKLKKIDKTTDYASDIKQLKKDMQVTSMYLEEQKAILKNYSIVAEKNGVVNFVSDMLYYGIVNSNDNVITVMYGEGDYYATADADDVYEIGTVYHMTNNVGEYEMELVSVEEEESQKKLHFRPYGSDAKVYTKTLDLVIEKETLKNVMYVSEKCIFEKEGKYYVYVINEDGFRSGLEVKIGDTVDGNTIIKSGVNAGDKVVIVK